jgi:hypothetical protein
MVGGYHLRSYMKAMGEKYGFKVRTQGAQLVCSRANYNKAKANELAPDARQRRKASKVVGYVSKGSESKKTTERCSAGICLYFKCQLSALQRLHTQPISDRRCWPNHCHRTNGD